MTQTNHRVCPVHRAGHLDSRIRGWIHNPEKILSPYVKEGMQALDMGCGPGFFSIPMARMVGENGHVVACDLQQGMLNRVAEKMKGNDIAKRLTLHRCQPESLDMDRCFDFVLAFYVVHELPAKQRFFDELKKIVVDGGQVLVVEPWFHVRQKDFNQTILRARNSGFLTVRVPGFLLSHAALLVRG